jgi:hypothetical protein
MVPSLQVGQLPLVKSQAPCPQLHNGFPKCIFVSSQLDMEDLEQFIPQIMCVGESDKVIGQKCMAINFILMKLFGQHLWIMSAWTTQMAEFICNRLDVPLKGICRPNSVHLMTLELHEIILPKVAIVSVWVAKPDPCEDAKVDQSSSTSSKSACDDFG